MAIGTFTTEAGTVDRDIGLRIGIATAIGITAAGAVTVAAGTGTPLLRRRAG
jgi:hypothetical protein